MTIEQITVNPSLIHIQYWSYLTRLITPRKASTVVKIEEKYIIFSDGHTSIAIKDVETLLKSDNNQLVQ